VVFRRTLLLCAAALAACRPRPDAAELLPQTVADVWRRTDLRDVPPGELPEPPARGTVRRVVRAGYAGPGRIEVTLFELASSGAALDAVQRFPHAAQTVFFYRDEYFTVVRWEDADREAVGSFVRGLEKHMAEARG
jgi:hypothetical protein